MKIFYNKIIPVFLLFSILTTLGCRKIDVEGFSPNEPSLSFQSEDLEVSNASEEYEIGITSNLPWRVKSDADWVSFSKENNTGDGAFKFEVSRNRSTEIRTAKIIAWITEDYQKTFTLIQQAGDPAPDYTQHFYVKVGGSTNKDGFSWENATTLDYALDNANSGDYIYVAKGKYIPSVAITNGNSSDEKEYTFEIKSNVTIIGGYSDNPITSEVANPKVNKTILSGNLGNTKVRHVVTVSAVMESDHKVSLSGLIIKEGEAGGGGSGDIAIEGTNYSRQHGGGMIIGKANVLVEDCEIIENSTTNHAAGMFITNSAVITIKNSKINDNVATIAASNGGGIWNDGSTIYLYDTTIDGNRIGGIGAGVYAINTARTSYTYMYNVTISNNVVGIFGQSRAAAGYYGRERSAGVMVNCTVANNVAQSNGAGISLYGGAKLDIISSTLAFNESATASGIHNNGNNILNIYNSIIAGNSSDEQTGGTNATKIVSSIIGNTVYDDKGQVVSSAMFDASTMLDALSDHGGETKTIALIGSTNPAFQYGMTSLQLQLLGINSDLDDSILVIDQLYKTRENKTSIGAKVD